MSFYIRELLLKKGWFIDKLVSRTYGTRPFNKIYQWGPDIPVEEMPSLQELLSRERKVPEPLNIGLTPKKQKSGSRLEKLKEIRSRRNAEMGAAARKRTLKVPIPEVESSWLESPGPHHIRSAAETYGIYKDLFGEGVYFIPEVPLRICYDYDDESVTPVHRGNCIKPKEACDPPSVQYESDADTMWTLLLTNPDGHLLQDNVECVHWLIGNIPGNNVNDGEIIYRYLQPFPPRGVGYQRMVFILFKQHSRIDFSFISRKEKGVYSLPARAFRTDSFYGKLEDALTPAGLLFFQADWDSSLKDFFHKSLRMREPIYEYDWPEPLKAEQKWFPKRKPFNEYLDRYRDPKDLAADVLKKRLKSMHPFQQEKVFPYPLALHRPLKYKEYVPEWLQLEQEDELLRRGKYRND